MVEHFSQAAAKDDAACPKIVVIGSINMDMVVRTDRIPGAGPDRCWQGFCDHSRRKRAPIRPSPLPDVAATSR